MLVVKLKTVLITVVGDIKEKSMKRLVGAHQYYTEFNGPLNIDDVRDSINSILWAYRGEPFNQETSVSIRKSLNNEFDKLIQMRYIKQKPEFKMVFDKTSCALYIVEPNTATELLAENPNLEVY